MRGDSNSISISSQNKIIIHYGGTKEEFEANNLGSIYGNNSIVFFSSESLIYSGGIFYSSIEEAPQDNKQYARINGTWAEVEAGAVSETALIAITPALSDLSGVSVMVTTNEGETVLDTTWQGTTLSCQIRAGLQYTVSVGDRDGFITPESVTYTAVKGASRSINMAYIESRLIVGILSNQENDATIAAVKATVEYGSTTVQVANGGTVNLPQDVDVTITFPDVEGYKTPDAITYSHTSGGYTKNGTYQTELVIVNVSAPNGASVDGQIVTVSIVEPGGGVTDPIVPLSEGLSSGQKIFTVSGGQVEFKVPFGKDYSIKINDMDGFTAPSAQSFTASQPVRNLSFVYKESNIGVFIKSGFDGKSYTVSEWDYLPSQHYAIGVVINTSNHKFGIMLDDISDAMQIYNTTDVAAALPELNLEQALMDYDGVGNTEVMVEAFSGGYAADMCQAAGSYEDIQTYLGSFGEWEIVRNNIGTVNEALNAALGSNLANELYWTSTRWGAVSYYTCYPNRVGDVREDKYMLTMSNHVRAFFVD